MGMTLVDLSVLYNLHFWAGYSIAALLDQAMPVVPGKRGTSTGRLLGEVVGQITALGYIYILLVPILGQLSNPLWRLVKEKGPAKPYKGTAAAAMLENAFILLGIICGSPNFMTKTRLLNRPELE